MITGGLGFIGSNLARQLVDLGADVMLVDSLIPDYGGSLENIRGIEDRVRVNVADIRQQTTMNYLVQGREVIFNLAGQVSHIDSMRDPYTDLEINCRSQMTVLEACRRNNPGVKVVFAGTRQIYGKPDYLPVDENHLVRPTDINGINKAAGEQYHLVYNNVFGVRACSLRLTNCYGPRQLVKHNRQGFIGWFIRRIVEDQEIEIFGDGMQMRDFVFVDDACDAFLRAGASDACNGQAVNVGGLEPIKHQRPRRADDRSRQHRQERVTWSGRQRRRRSTSAASTPTRPASGNSRGGSRPSRSARGSPAPSRSTASTCSATCDDRSRRTRAVPVVEAGRGCRRAPGRREPGHRSGMVHPRPRTRGARGASSPRASGAAHAVGVNTGTDAIALLLRAMGIGPGDEVITAPLSAAYTALAVMMAGARPVFADIDPERHTIDPGAVDAAITPRTAAIMPVHLYGQPADMTALAAIATRHGLALVEDAAQAHLATCEGRPVGSFGARRGLQFLSHQEPWRVGGCRSDHDQRRDAGRSTQAPAQRRPANDLPARRVRSEFAARRDAGRDPSRTPAAVAGVDRAAPRHRRALPGRCWLVRPCTCPASTTPATSITCSWCARPERDAFRAHMATQGVQTLVHYPKALTQQAAILSESPASCPEAERAADEVCSLPLYPSLSMADADLVAAAVQSFRR